MTSTDLTLDIESEVLIAHIAAKDVYTWVHSHLLPCIRMDIHVHQNCVKMCLFLVNRARAIQAIHVALVAKPYGLRVGKPADTQAEGAPAGCPSLYSVPDKIIR